ncbi:LysR family transcriptional regulator [Frankia sp. AiPs1]|uniref:LysR family transcriptional regulator n=1 Tax=Frankia sp. AiPs1 TaxID=573493 RepID=UPI002043697B|nr:LysR family transcriptional regulator [Frankia sp. AiPs1]MCM3924814.1 LysR family transcriptional regulator [Frankia sp. AiPs1]
MEIGQLRAFVILAEEGHVGRTAARLHLTPSPVSRSIRALEHELGVELFARGHHSVELTEAGRAALPRIEAALRSLAEARFAARQAAGQLPPLRLGSTHFAPPHVVDRVVSTIGAFLAGAPSQDRAPETPEAPEAPEAPETPDGSLADLVHNPSSELLPALDRGELDLALVHLPVDDPALDVLPLVAYRLRVAMRADDELATRSCLHLADLRDREILLTPTRLQPLAMRRLQDRLEQVGHARVVTMREQDLLLLANTVRRSRQLTLTGSVNSGPAGRVFADPVFALVPLAAGEIDFQLGLAWSRATAARDPRITAVVDHLRASTPPR